MAYNVRIWIQIKIFKPGVRNSWQNVELQSVHRANEKGTRTIHKKETFVPPERSTEQ